MQFFFFSFQFTFIARCNPKHANARIVYGIYLLYLNMLGRGVVCCAYGLFFHSFHYGWYSNNNDFEFARRLRVYTKNQSK